MNATPSPAPAPWAAAAWLAAALAIGFAVPAVFAGVLHWPRNWYLVAYLLVAGVLLAAYFRRMSPAPGAWLLRRWPWGLVGAAVAGALTVANVLAQPASSGPGGGWLLFHVAWLGIVYGTLDGLFLTVMPVHLVFRALGGETAPTGWGRALGAGLLALAASLAVTAAYHLGYPEFRGLVLLGPVLGNAVFTVAMLLTGSPTAAVLGHVAMHVAAVLYGFDTAGQLPPHG